MALPIIVFDTSSGSDTLSSGAGPGDSYTSGSALNGTTNASTDVAGTTITLPAGTDLTNVATDGSHVIWINDTTANARNFARITGKAGSGGATPTVSVTDAFATGLTNKTWAIGGMRQTLAGSSRLLDNQGVSGGGGTNDADAYGGWTLRLKSGYTETLAASLNLRANSGNAFGSNGPLTLEGEDGYSTLPLLTFTNNDYGLKFVNYGAWYVFRNFELQNTNATKTASYAISAPYNSWFDNIVISHATNKFYRGISIGNADRATTVLTNCIVKNCADIGVYSTSWPALLVNCVVSNNGSHGVVIDSKMSGLIGCQVTGNGGSGVVTGLVGGTGGVDQLGILIDRCTIANNSSHGYYVKSTFAGLPQVWNSSITSNGSYGIKFDEANIDYTLASFGRQYRNNNFGTGSTANGSGNTDLNTTRFPQIWRNNVNVDPQYVDAANGNFTIGKNMQGLGIGGSPVPVGGSSGTYHSYVDIGAFQRPENSGAIGNNWAGGVRPRAFAPGLAR